MNVFKWRKRGARRPEPQGLRIKVEDEELTGFVQGESASDIEERMFRAFLYNGVDYGDIVYQPSYIAGKNLPGEIRPDFALFLGLIQLWFADGDYWHKSAQDKQKDELNDSILFQRLEGRAEYPIRIPGSELQTQEDANRVVGEYLG
jgi:hypothetical protein